MADMKYFTSNDGYQLAYQDVGDPFLPPLILLHGFTGSHLYFKHNIPLLTPHYHIIAPDLRGHGSSAKTPHGFHVSRLAMDLHNLITHLGYPTPSQHQHQHQHQPSSIRTIAGSLGCAILWSYAELFTADIFSHMIWIDQSPMQNYSLDPSRTWGSSYANRGMNGEDAVRGLFAHLARDPDQVYRGTVAACLAYRSHPRGSSTSDDEADGKKKASEAEDEAFFLAEAQKGVPEWYAQLMKDHTALDWRAAITQCFGGRRENRTRVLVVASSRSGCFPAEGPMAAVGFANRGAVAGESEGGVGERAEGVVVDWGGHWCFWEDPARFHELVVPFLGKA